MILTYLVLQSKFTYVVIKYKVYEVCNYQIIKFPDLDC